MERVFLDTNILLDFLLGREPFARHAEDILQLRFTHKKRFFVSALSIANAAYVVRRAGQNPFQVVHDLMEWVDVVNLTKIEFKSTVKSTFKDFEDGLQFFSAQQIDADVIVTRNVKDFSTSSILVQSPLQFLTAIKK
jgi:predicted nucleic acid-binding protein